MLLADKNDLQNQLKLQILKVEEKELDLYVRNCHTLATQAACVAAFVPNLQMIWPFGPNPSVWPFRHATSTTWSRQPRRHRPVVGDTRLELNPFTS